MSRIPEEDRVLLSHADVAAGLPAGWRHRDGALHAHYATGDFATGLRLVAAIGEAAEAADHHPDLDLRYAAVTVRLSSHDVGGVTARDLRLAHEVSRLAGGVVPAGPEEPPVDEPDR